MKPIVWHVNAAATAIWMLALAPEPRAQTTPSTDVTVTVDHNIGAKATHDFTFDRVPSPVKDDAGAKATIAFVTGDLDQNSEGLAALNDGLLPRDEDEPGLNFFFDAATPGGSFRMDLQADVDIAQVNSYSWHPNTRGPQVYVLYASDGHAASFNPSPAAATDPASVGWTKIAAVDTRQAGNDGGQYGVSIARPGGLIGRDRYLLFVCSATERDDDYGNTFFSEIDVVAAKSSTGGGRPALSR